MLDNSRTLAYSTVRTFMSLQKLTGCSSSADACSQMMPSVWSLLLATAPSHYSSSSSSTVMARLTSTIAWNIALESRGQFVCTCSACETLLEKLLEFSSLVFSLFRCLVLCFQPSSVRGLDGLTQPYFVYKTLKIFISSSTCIVVFLHKTFCCFLVLTRIVIVLPVFLYFDDFILNHTNDLTYDNIIGD